MSRVEPLARAELDPELQAIMVSADEIMGFTPNDALVMAHKPAMLKAMLGLISAVYQPGLVPLEFKKLLALMVSSAAGCQYCKAHTQFGAMREGVTPEKLAAIWDFQRSELFTDGERAALNIALSAAASPNETTDADFALLKTHYSDEEVVEIVGVIAMFGFLNRWNSTLATELEETPQAAITAAGL